MTAPYFLSPGSKSLLTLFGAEHSPGGIGGYEARENWSAAQKALPESTSSLGRIESNCVMTNLRDIRDFNDLLPVQNLNEQVIDDFRAN